MVIRVQSAIPVRNGGIEVGFMMTALGVNTQIFSLNFPLKYWKIQGHKPEGKGKRTPDELAEKGGQERKNMRCYLFGGNHR